MNSAPKPDFTAWFVMQGIIAAMRHPAGADIRDEAALALYQPLSDASKRARLVTRITTSLPYPWQCKIHELVTNAGRLRFFCFRKKMIEQEARKTLSAGDISQVIILGAGLDVLSLRLALEFPLVNFIEIDTEQSQRFKKNAFDAGNISIPKNVEYLAGDLRNPLSNILSLSRLHNKGAKSLWIAEGFLMFVPEDSVIRIFQEIKAVSASGSYVIFTTIPFAYPGKAFAQTLQKIYMRKEKCPYAWVIDSQNIRDFVRNSGFVLENTISYEKLQESDTKPKYEQSKRLIEDIHIAAITNL